MIQRMLVIWSLVPLPFLNPAWASGSSAWTYYWSLAWGILSIILLVCEMSAIVWYFEHSLTLPFFEIVMKTDFFQSCGHCWVFQICCHIEGSSMVVWIIENWNILQEMRIPDHLTCLLRNQYTGQEVTIRTIHGAMNWFKIEKGVHQSCILSPCLFNLYAECIVWNAELDAL